VWTPAVPTGRRDVLLESVNARIFAALQELAERRPSWSFTVKLHPYALHRQFHPRRRLANLRVLQSEPLGPVLEAASVVVAWNTTVVLEAVAMDRPLVGPSLGLLPEFVPAATLGVAIEVRAIGELEPAIEAALRLDGCPNREAYLAKVMPYGADEAAGRVLAVIKGELGM
jgi:UDP-N-acetylglucosamine 2-epimerase